MKLHNTLTRQTEDFTPYDTTKVRMYSCGPTVYDHIHIGNLSAFIYADTLRRALQTADYVVQHVMNFTDVDDKTINRSQQKFPNETPENALKKLTAEYSKIFMTDMERIGNDVHTIEFMNATDHIEAMRGLIKELHADGFAYVADDGVYFSITKYLESGKKYGQLTEITSQSTSESRIQNDEYDKESVHDFALWKKRKAGEPAWEFELDGHDVAGRPGWHIECSAMSVAKLGQPFDIHTGGIDLIFPHHENEIAQSTAGKTHILSKLFFHNEHLMVENKKMSKSLNNFYTLRDIEDKSFDPLSFRLMVLQSHYRSQSNFTWDNLEAAQNRLQNYRSMADMKFQASTDAVGVDAVSINKHMQKIEHAMIEDDLNTPIALAELSKVEEEVVRAGINQENLTAFNLFLEKIDKLFSLELSSRKDITSEQKQLIARRQAARENKNWDLSDKLRHKLQAQGISVKDTDHGPIWSRI